MVIMKILISIKGDYDGKNGFIESLETSMNATPENLKALLTSALKKVEDDVKTKTANIKAFKKAKALRRGDAKPQKAKKAGKAAVAKSTPAKEKVEGKDNGQDIKD